MNDRMQRNQPAIVLVLGIVLGLVFLIAWAVTREPLALAGAVLLFIVALMGDRLKKAPGGWEFYRARIATAVRVEAPPPVTGTGALEHPPAEVHGTGTVYERGVEDTLATVDEGVGVVVTPAPAEARLEGIPPTVVTSSAQALIAAAEALDTAATPEELAERVVEYVGLRNAPSLRGLSADRIRREKDLFGAILELQTRRARGVDPRDGWKLGAMIDGIEVFWTRPELLSDESVEDLTAQIQAAIADMGGVEEGG